MAIGPPKKQVAHHCPALALPQRRFRCAYFDPPLSFPQLSALCGRPFVAVAGLSGQCFVVIKSSLRFLIGQIEKAVWQAKRPCMDLHGPARTFTDPTMETCTISPPTGWNLLALAMGSGKRS